MARVLCALSGGVDSSVAALLLQQAGHEVVGVFMRNGVAAGHGAGRSRSCCSASDAADAARVADRLGIPFFAVDFAREFADLIEGFVAEYARGRTPSPCIHCNQDLKFGHLFTFAAASGAEVVATGHYARVADGRLLRARDPAKDQTYYLFGIRRERLHRIAFPIGDLDKTQVRALARQHGLPVADKPESMEICFVPGDDYREVVRAHRGATTPGEFVDLQGRVLGSHDGIEGFTVGQRRGLPAGPEARYVVALEPATRRVVLGRREDLRVPGARLSGMHWLCDPIAAGTSRPVVARLRARHEGVPALVTPGPEGSAVLRFQHPDGPVTPGQAAVLHDGEQIVGGGWIEEALPLDV
jgi:tRNA-specific 2-thiouridylase